MIFKLSAGIRVTVHDQAAQVSQRTQSSEAQRKVARLEVSNMRIHIHKVWQVQVWIDVHFHT